MTLPLKLLYTGTKMNSTPKGSEGTPQDSDDDFQEMKFSKSKSGKNEEEAPEKPKEKKKSKKNFSEYIIIQLNNGEDEEPENHQYRFDVKAEKDENKKIQKIIISLYDNDNIFFCMKSVFTRRDFVGNKSKRYIIPFDQLYDEITSIFRSYQKGNKEFEIWYTITGTSGVMKIYQTTPIIRKELISFNFESISEEDSDKLAQEEYLRIEARLQRISRKLNTYNEGLKQKNPKIYDDILINGQDYAHTHAEKKKALEHFLESNQKVSAGIAHIQQKNKQCPLSLSPRKGK